MSCLFCVRTLISFLVDRSIPDDPYLRYLTKDLGWTVSQGLVLAKSADRTDRITIELSVAKTRCLTDTDAMFQIVS